MTTNLSSDKFKFLRRWAASPAAVGALSPSGASLSALITSTITPALAPVLELGPGTGVFTNALLERGVREEDLTLVECDLEFADLLQSRYPRARVLWMDASRIAYADGLSPSSFGAVVSGLPLLNLPTRKVMAVLEGAFSLLRPGGNYHQFTYGPACPVARRVLDRLGLRARRSGRTLFNMPPASVYTISARQSRPRRVPVAGVPVSQVPAG